MIPPAAQERQCPATAAALPPAPRRPRVDDTRYAESSAASRGRPVWGYSHTHPFAWLPLLIQLIPGPSTSPLQSAAAARRCGSAAPCRPSEASSGRSPQSLEPIPPLVPGPRFHPPHTPPCSPSSRLIPSSRSVREPHLQQSELFPNSYRPFNLWHRYTLGCTPM